MWDLVPRPGIEPGLPALEVRSLTHWTTREVPYNVLKIVAVCLHSGHFEAMKYWQEYFVLYLDFIIKYTDVLRYQ